MLEFENKSTQPKASNHIPTSCSRAKFLILVTFLNLDIIYGNIPFNVIQCPHLKFFLIVVLRPPEYSSVVILGK